MLTTNKSDQSAHALILAAIGEGVYGLDANGLCTFANQASVDILGWSASEIIGEPLHDIHHHSHPDGSPYPREECPIYAALTDGEVHTVSDEVFWHANGKAIPVDYTSTPVKEDGKVVGAVVVFRDTTERTEFEAERERVFNEISSLKVQLEQERDFLRAELRSEVRYRGIIGSSPALQRTLAQIQAVASTPASVLIQGESGVGKEAIARAIHEESDRRDGPLVKVNCASIPSDLFESEFFGHVKGAFTGAHRDRVGRLQLADGGTLFLDEVGEIPASQQGKLLRALQEQEFERVGDDRTNRVNVRIVAATNRDLDLEVKEGRFREDLFYRLSVFPIEVPPLRERKEDIAELAHHFSTTASEEMGKDPLDISTRDLDLLQSHNWPGNIRELKNVVERAVILSSGQRLRLDLVLNPPPKSAASIGNVDHASDGSRYLTEEEFIAFERANLSAALAASGWRVSGEGGAAERLGLKPSTLAYRMKKLGLEQSEG